MALAEKQRMLRFCLHVPLSTETFLQRFSKGSGVEGLGGMYPISVWSEVPRVNILRPLLELRKAELKEVCQSEGVEWIEHTGPSSQSSISKFLDENEDLALGIAQLIHTCQDVRKDLKLQGMMFTYAHCCC